MTSISDRAVGSVSQAGHGWVSSSYGMLGGLRIGLMNRCDEADVAEVARILYEGLGDKLGVVFGSLNTFKRFLLASINCSMGVAAVLNERVVGFAGLKTESDSWIRPRVRELLKALGPFRLTRFAVLGLPLHYGPAPSEVLIDVLAVDGRFRGRGIGTSLIRFVLDYGRGASMRRVKLYVADRNERARRLYERLGFSVSRVVSIPFPYNRIYGIRHMYEMIQELR